jgi:DNA-binding phage protein
MVTTRFDAAEYLDNPERRVEYLPAALETVDAAFIRDAVSVAERARHLTVGRMVRQRAHEDGQR